MSATKSNIADTAKIVAKLLRHKERDKYSPNNLPNSTYPLVSNIETLNYTFTFKKSTGQPEGVDFVEAMIN